MAVVAPGHPEEDLAHLVRAIETGENAGLLSAYDLAELFLNYVGSSDGSAVAIRAMVLGAAYRTANLNKIGVKK